jgi:Pyruvate:ferredoxin oxidoreductase core domain II/Pyruvate flavodoxin/ferredoxin oxidoreductase, thiamine diP-bdg
LILLSRLIESPSEPNCELPVMVCMDGFTLTHTLEPIDLPTQEQVDSFLPPYRFKRALDPVNPITIGNLVAPEYYSEARYVHHQALLRAQEEITAADRDWEKVTGRTCGGLVSVDGPEDPRVAILSIGSVMGTLFDARDEFAELGAVKLIKLRSMRPFPTDELQGVCAGLSELVVLERALSLGGGGIVGAEVRAALSGMESAPRIHNFAAGLGGRDMPLTIYPRLLEAAKAKQVTRFAILAAGHGGDRPRRDHRERDRMSRSLHERMAAQFMAGPVDSLAVRKRSGGRLGNRGGVEGSGTPDQGGRDGRGRQHVRHRTPGAVRDVGAQS